MWAGAQYTYYPEATPLVQAKSPVSGDHLKGSGVGRGP